MECTQILALIITRKILRSTEWAFKQVMQKEKFIDYAKTWTDFGVDFIGGCCGVNVDHIKELKR